ncbi:hypothetical protein COO60DRAFT_1628938, partial [Scenedesmus sp. NREL 46B-D3]
MDRQSQHTHAPAAKWGDIVDDELGSAPAGGGNRTLSGVIQESSTAAAAVREVLSTNSSCFPAQHVSLAGLAASEAAAARQRGPAAAAAAAAAAGANAWGDRRRWETDRTPGTHGRWEVLGVNRRSSSSAHDAVAGSPATAGSGAIGSYSHHAAAQGALSYAGADGQQQCAGSSASGTPTSATARTAAAAAAADHHHHHGSVLGISSSLSSSAYSGHHRDDYSRDGWGSTATASGRGGAAEYEQYNGYGASAVPPGQHAQVPQPPPGHSPGHHMQYSSTGQHAAAADHTPRRVSGRDWDGHSSRTASWQQHQQQQQQQQQQQPHVLYQQPSAAAAAA